MKATFLILLSLFPSFPFVQSVERKDSVELDILEAVFRHQIDHCYKDRLPKVYFLSYQENDPSDALLEKLRIQGAFVRKRSQMFAFKDKQTGERGIILAIVSIKSRSNIYVEVKASCAAALLDGYSYVYRIVRKDDKWIVKSRKLTGMS